MRPLAWIGWLVAIIGAAPTSAGTLATADVTVQSAYVGRGVTMTDRFVLQPDASVAFEASRVTLLLGGWGNIEPRRYGPERISQSAGAEAGWTELDLYAELGRAIGPARLVGGAVGYLYPNPSGMTAAANTAEVYARAEFAGPLAPRLALFEDVGRIHGAYLEAGLSHTWRPFPRFTPECSALAGWCAGQAPAPGQLAGFAADGLTHLDFGVAGRLHVGAAEVKPALHLLINHDRSTRAIAPGREGDLKFVFGATLGGSHEWRHHAPPTRVATEESHDGE